MPHVLSQTRSRDWLLFQPRWWIWAILSSPGVLVAADHPGVPERADAETVGTAKDFAIFIGLDVTVPQEGKYLRIEEFANQTARVRSDGHDRTYKLSELREMRFLREPKVSGTMVTVASLRAEPTFKNGNDPRQQALWAQMAVQDVGDNAVNTAELELGQAIMTRGSDPSSAARIDEAIAHVEDTRQNANAQDLAMLNYHGPNGGEENGATPDAVEVSFNASVPRALNDVYAALIFLIEMPGEHGVNRQTVRFRRLGDLGATPKQIQMLAGGFPRGFALKGVRVHLYAGTEELATNLSENCVGVTRDEAHQFLVMQYCLAHHTETVAPIPIRELTDPTMRKRVSPGDLAREVIVTVDATGRPREVRAFGDHAVELSEAIRQGLAAARFYPALNAGLPVASSYSGTVDEML